MSTHLERPAQEAIAPHPGGIFYDLSGHMIDQIVWILGRPTKVTSFLRQDATDVPGFSDNTLCVLEYDSAIAFVDIAAVETPPMARRFEVYGTIGDVGTGRIPFWSRSNRYSAGRPGPIRFLSASARTGPGFPAGVRPFDGGGAPAALRRQPGVIRKGSYAARRPPTGPWTTELLVQETILRCTGAIASRRGYEPPLYRPHSRYARHGRRLDSRVRENDNTGIRRLLSPVFLDLDRGTMGRRGFPELDLPCFRRWRGVVCEHDQTSGEET